jgi:nicotinate-nucleotide adenylyltransferase
VAAIEAALATGRFDEVVVTVAGDPYQKSATQQLSSSAIRFAMAKAAFSSLDNVRVSDIELDRDGPTYTIDTVLALRYEASDVQLLVGADVAASIDTWHRSKELSSLCVLNVVPREDVMPVFSEAWTVFLVPMKPVDLSSSWIREVGGNVESLEKFLPSGVVPLWLAARG